MYAQNSSNQSIDIYVVEREEVAVEQPKIKEEEKSETLTP